MVLMSKLMKLLSFLLNGTESLVSIKESLNVTVLLSSFVQFYGSEHVDGVLPAATTRGHCRRVRQGSRVPVLLLDF